MKLGLGEIFEKASQQKTKDEKIAVLQQYQSVQLLDLIQYAYHPAISWDLPPGAPPYKPTDYLDQEGMLPRECRRLYLFVNGNGSRLSPTKLQNLFLQILECVAPKDAELLLLIKDRKLPKGLTKSVVEEAFPGLLAYEQTEEVPQE